MAANDTLSPTSTPQHFVFSPQTQDHATILGLVLAAGLFLLGVVKALPYLQRRVLIAKIPRWTSSHWTDFFLGNLVDFLQPNHHLMLRKGAKVMGGIYRIDLAWVQCVVVTDARYVAVLFGATENLSKAIESEHADRMTSVNGHPTLFSSRTDSNHFKLVRKGTSPAFQYKNIRNGFPGVLKMTHQLVDNIGKLGPETAIDVNNIFMRYAMDVTGLVGFGKDFGTCRSFSDSDTDELFDILRDGMLEVYKGATNPLRPLCLHIPEVRNANKILNAYKQRMRDLVAEVKARGPVSESDPSIAAHLLRIRDPATGLPLDDDLLTGEFSVFFTAGIESAGNAMTWSIFLISQWPEVEAKVCAELDAIGLLATPERPNPRPMELNDLQKMPYFANVCKETMRFKPVASSGSTRMTEREVKLGSYTLPRGTLVLAPFDAVHHSPLNWEDPDEFKPERWDAPGAEFIPGTQKDDEGGVKRFLAFSTGPRKCIGFSLARMMHDVGIAVLLSHYTFKLAPEMGGVEGVLATEINRLTLQPANGLWCNATPRVPPSPAQN